MQRRRDLQRRTYIKMYYSYTLVWGLRYIVIDIIFEIDIMCTDMNSFCVVINDTGLPLVSVTLKAILTCRYTDNLYVQKVSH